MGHAFLPMMGSALIAAISHRILTTLHRTALPGRGFVIGPVYQDSFCPDQVVCLVINLYALLDSIAMLAMRFQTVSVCHASTSHLLHFIFQPAVYTMIRIAVGPVTSLTLCLVQLVAHAIYLFVALGFIVHNASLIQTASVQHAVLSQTMQALIHLVFHTIKTTVVGRATLDFSKMEVNARYAIHLFATLVNIELHACLQQMGFVLHAQTSLVIRRLLLLAFLITKILVIGFAILATSWLMQVVSHAM